MAFSKTDEPIIGQAFCVVLLMNVLASMYYTSCFVVLLHFFVYNTLCCLYFYYL